MVVKDPVLKKKWERVFYTFFDLNHSKSIDYGDFEILFEKVKELRGEKSTEFVIAQDAMGAVWRGLCSECKGLDMHDDIPEGVEIDIDAWDAMWSRYNPRTMPIWMWEYVKYMFFLLDSSGDKFIDEKEYSEVLTIYGVKKEEAMKSYEAFAKDSKGRPMKKIDYGQFVRLWNDYFTSTDPNCKANHLFGP